MDTIPATKKQRVANRYQISAKDRERSVITDDVETPLLNGKPIDQCILEAVTNASSVSMQQLAVSSLNSIPITDYVTTNWAYPLSVLEVSANRLQLTYNNGDTGSSALTASDDGLLVSSSIICAKQLKLAYTTDSGDNGTSTLAATTSNGTIQLTAGDIQANFVGAQQLKLAYVTALGEPAISTLVATEDGTVEISGDVRAHQFNLVYTTDLGSNATTSIAAISDGTVQISSGITASGNVNATSFLATEDILANRVITANLTVTGTTSLTHMLDAMGIRVNGISVVEYTPPVAENTYLTSTPRTEAPTGKISLSGSDLTLIGSAYIGNAYIGFRSGESLCVWPGYSLFNEGGADMAGRYNKTLVVDGNLSVDANINGGTNGQEGGSITCQSITVNGNITADALNDTPITEYVTIATLEAGVLSIAAKLIDAEQIKLNGTPLSTIIESSSGGGTAGGAGNTVDGDDSSFTGNLQVGGNLHCAGDINATSINAEEIKLNGTPISAIIESSTSTGVDGDDSSFTGNLHVGGNLHCIGEINATSIRVNGTLLDGTASMDGAITDENNHFSGNLSVDGEINAHDLKVDGTAISLYQVRTGRSSLVSGTADVDVEVAHGSDFATLVLDSVNQSNSNPNLQPVVVVHDTQGWPPRRGHVFVDDAGKAFIHIVCQNQSSTNIVAYTLTVGC